MSTTHEFRKHETFKCRICKGKAQMLEVDGRLDSVRCLTCNVSVKAPDARLMYETLRERYVIQEGRNFNRRLMNKRGMGRVPLTKVDNEFSDPKWPFILVAKDEG